MINHQYVGLFYFTVQFDLLQNVVFDYFFFFFYN